MGIDLKNLSSHELAQVIENAQNALAEKQKNERRAVVAKIKELADSIGITVSFQEGQRAVSSRKGSKVAAKYRNPQNPSETWTGRGVRPRWLQAQLDSGRNIEDFKI
jgi:DNA-binding protein H-NS